MLLNPKTVLVDADVSIRGVSRRTKEVRDDKDGNAREFERNVTTRIAVETEYNAARELASQYRHAVVKWCVSTRLGQLSDPDKVKAMHEGLKPIEAAIAVHNRASTAHEITHSLICLPIDVALDREAAKALCEQVRGELDRARALLVAGDVVNARVWLNRNRNLASLVPGSIGSALDEAIAEVRELRKAIVKRIGEGGTPEAAEAAVSFVALDTAVGLVAPPVAPLEPEAEIAATVH